MKNRKRDIALRGGSTGGGRAFGYRQDGTYDAKGKYIPAPTNGQLDEIEATEIRKAVQLILSGGSIYAIRRDWMERGVKTVKDARTPDGKPSWSRGAIRGILTSPRRAGLRVHNGEVISEAQWPAIIDRETHEAVCALIKDPSRRNPPANRESPLRGVASCSLCGTKLSPMARRRHDKVQRYYGCRKDSNGCGGVYITADRVEEYVLGVLLVLAESPATLALFESESQANAEALRALAMQRSDDIGLLQELKDALVAENPDERLDMATYNTQARVVQSALMPRTSASRPSVVTQPSGASDLTSKTPGRR